MAEMACYLANLERDIACAVNNSCVWMLSKLTDLDCIVNAHARLVMQVIVKMEHDTKGEWGDVMFVPPNALVSTRS